MMKITIALVAILGVALAFPQNQVLTRSEIRDDFNQFALSYSTDTGIAVAQQGALKTVQTPNGPINIPIQQGSYAFYTPEGKKITTYWVADELGFRVLGDHLPVAPEAPVAPIVAI